MNFRSIVDMIVRGDIVNTLCGAGGGGAWHAFHVF
jgi:hypothetical protein